MDFVPFPRALVQSETLTVSFWIRSRVADSITYNNNRYAKDASLHV